MEKNPIIQLSLARLRELLRQPEAVFWVFFFPILLALALGIAFREERVEVFAIAVQEGSEASRIRSVLDADQGLRVRLLDEAAARDELRTGKVALVVVPGEPVTYWCG